MRVLQETDKELEPLTIAKVLKGVVEKETPDVVLVGKQSIDGDYNQTGPVSRKGSARLMPPAAGQMLAGLLGWPQGTYASGVEPSDGGLKVKVVVESRLAHHALV